MTQNSWKNGFDDEVLPISVNNQMAFIILHEDKCVETKHGLLIAMT
jgi:hypothetical protein